MTNIFASMVIPMLIQSAELIRVDVYDTTAKSCDYFHEHPDQGRWEEYNPFVRDLIEKRKYNEVFLLANGLNILSIATLYQIDSSGTLPFIYIMAINIIEIGFILNNTIRFNSRTEILGIPYKANAKFQATIFICYL